jgi:hypothetical protein
MFKTLSFILILASNGLFGQNPQELGKVKWLRNWDEAVTQSQKQVKPIFILFQEVPGCHTCTTFGDEVMSHPLIVELIESYFIPLAIYNNIDGHDRDILKKFNEATWNNPQVRIVNNSAKDIIPANKNIYTKSGILGKIYKALIAQNIVVPKYMQLLENEFAIEEGNIETTYFSMYCFWTGEKEIANIEGVLATDAGFMNGEEVVKIKFNKELTSVDQMFKKAREVKCGDTVFAAKENAKADEKGSYRQDKESKYYLYKSDFKYVPMTAYQAMKVNALLGNGISPDYLLSPRQLAIYKNTKGLTSGIRPDFEDFYNSWNWN